MGSIIKVDHLSYVYNPGMPNCQLLQEFVLTSNLLAGDNHFD